jgi:hypothetical protein
MQRGGGVELPRENVLKVDKDCHIDRQLEQQYIQDSIAILRKHGITVEQIKATRTYHGRHYYITIHPPVDAHTANNLQYLLGDDSKRVGFNEARINSKLAHWNILFEAVGRKLMTLYHRRGRSKNSRKRW